LPSAKQRGEACSEWSFPHRFLLLPPTLLSKNDTSYSVELLRVIKSSFLELRLQFKNRFWDPNRPLRKTSKPCTCGYYHYMFIGRLIELVFPVLIKKGKTYE
jgi:hypothetical protein